MLTTSAWTRWNARAAALTSCALFAGCAAESDDPPLAVGAAPGTPAMLVVEARLEGVSADDTLLRLTAEGYREEVRTGSDGLARVSDVPDGPLQVEATGPDGTAVWVGVEGRALTLALPSAPGSVEAATVTLEVEAIAGLADVPHEVRGGFTVGPGEVEATAPLREAAGATRCTLGPAGCTLALQVPVGTRQVIATVVEQDAATERIVAFAATSRRELTAAGLDVTASPLTPLRETPVTLGETGVAGVIGVPGVAPADGSVFLVPFMVPFLVDGDGVVALPELEDAAYWLIALADEGRAQSIGRSDGQDRLAPPAFASPAEPRSGADGVAFDAAPGEVVFATVADEAGGLWEVLWLDPARPWSPPEDAVGALTFAVRTIRAQGVSASAFELNRLLERFETLTRSRFVLEE